MRHLTPVLQSLIWDFSGLEGTELLIIRNGEDWGWPTNVRFAVHEIIPQKTQFPTLTLFRRIWAPLAWPSLAPYIPLKPTRLILQKPILASATLLSLDLFENLTSLWISEPSQSSPLGVLCRLSVSTLQTLLDLQLPKLVLSIRSLTDRARVLALRTGKLIATEVVFHSEGPLHSSETSPTYRTQPLLPDTEPRHKSQNLSNQFHPEQLTLNSPLG